MNVTRYFITILGLLPVLLFYGYATSHALRKARTSRRAGVWRIAIGAAVLLIVWLVLTEFHDWTWMPRRLTGIAQAFINLGGLLSGATGVVWLAFRFVARRLPRRFQVERRIALKAVAGIGLAAPTAIAGYGVFIERTNLEVCETNVGIRNLPRELDGLRILQISDIHLGPYLSERTLAKVIDGSNELNPDLAFITGDLISAQGDPLDACLRQLGRLRVNGPTLGCLGNHEIYAHAVDSTVRGGARVGIDFLRKRSRIVNVRGAALNVAGVDYQSISARARYLRHCESLVAPGVANILLSHNPDVFPVAAAQGYDLTLAGHTHGGQVTCEILTTSINPARFLTPFIRGLYRKGDRACYVSRGIGTLGVPARLGARPEITFLKLRHI